MSNGNLDAMPTVVEPRGYQRSRLNAVRHGILSQHVVLPWEDRAEFDELLESLLTEHRPNGPTEHHLVEELAGLLWRKQRLALAEASAYRAGLHRILDRNPLGGDRVLLRALAHLHTEEPTEDAAAAIRATPEDTEAELRSLAEDEAMTERALAILRQGKAGAYSKALAAAHEDTLTSWRHAEADAVKKADAGPLRDDAANREADDWSRARRSERAGIMTEKSDLWPGDLCRTAHGRGRP